MSGTLTVCAKPYDEAGTLLLQVTASAGGFSGFAEIYASPAELARFGQRLRAFPSSLNDSVSYAYGDESGEWPYHLRLSAEVIDSRGHSVLHVAIRSFISSVGAASVELRIAAEPAQLNALGASLEAWPYEPGDPLVWQPRA